MLETIRYPIVQAPMAGGPATPELAAAVTNAGGLGFLAAGYKKAEQVRQEIKQTRKLTSGPFGVNLFVPAVDPIDFEQVHIYVERVRKDIESVGAVIGEPVADDDDWNHKLAVVIDEKVPIVSFTFGCPEKYIVQHLKENGIYVIITVTSVEEAEQATEAGADALCVQGIEAGGHQATFNNRSLNNPFTIRELIPMVAAVCELPLIAAGGIMSGGEILDVMKRGAQFAQLGTAFLRCPESGAHDVYKQAFGSTRFVRTAITYAFTGRPARGLVNLFMEKHSAYAPAAYPALHQITQPMRRGAAGSQNPELMSLWAGEGFERALEQPAAKLMERLIKEMGKVELD